VEMTAIAIANSVEVRAKVRQDREARYMSIIGDYTKSQQQVFPELVSILVASLERNSEQDFLGEMFMALELGNHWKGQFFTPYSVCQMMAKITVQDAADKIMAKGYVTVNDPACGAGATLIAARNALELMHIGSSQVWFVGQDIDRLAGMMCYIQLSLLGCAGYVVIADTICNPLTGPVLWPNLKPDQEAWFMPMNFIDPAWVCRQFRRDEDQPPVSPTESAPVPAEQKKEETPSLPKAEPQEAQAATQEPMFSITESDSGQLTLF